MLPYRNRFGLLLRLAQLARPLLPPSLRRAVPRREPGGTWPAVRHARRMLILDGCVQPALAPNINAATARVLDRLGISVVVAPRAGCCGAMSHHLGDTTLARAFARHNIDAWWPEVEAGAEALITTASGCGVHVKDYGHLLRDDPAYASKAERIAGLTKDLGEVLAAEDLGRLKVPAKTIAFQSPCTLQHGQKLNGLVEGVLRRLGFVLTPVPDAHLCCGSAGTYSLLQPNLSGALRERKLDALLSGKPELVATANIGCLAHLQRTAPLPVRHWVELLDGTA